MTQVTPFYVPSFSVPSNLLGETFKALIEILEVRRVSYLPLALIAHVGVLRRDGGQPDRS